MGSGEAVVGVGVGVEEEAEETDGKRWRRPVDARMDVVAVIRFRRDTADTDTLLDVCIGVTEEWMIRILD